MRSVVKLGVLFTAMNAPPSNIGGMTAMCGGSLTVRCSLSIRSTPLVETWPVVTDPLESSATPVICRASAEP